MSPFYLNKPDNFLTYSCLLDLQNAMVKKWFGAWLGNVQERNWSYKGEKNAIEAGERYLKGVWLFIIFFKLGEITALLLLMRMIEWRGTSNVNLGTRRQMIKYNVPEEKKSIHKERDIDIN